MKIIASWGSSGAGKTTIALALAAALTKKRNDVLLIGSDSRTPSLPVYLPGSTALTGSASLGSLLEGAITEGALKGRIHRHPKSEHLYCMGLVSGELSGITYKPAQRSAVAGLVQLLRQSPFSYLIVDCDTTPIYDPLTLYALEHAQAVLQAVSPDVKGYEGLKAQLGWLNNSEAFQAREHVKICNAVLPTTPMKEAGALFGGFDVTLPYANQVGEHLLAGELLTGFHAPSAIAFESKITSLAARLEATDDD